MDDRPDDDLIRELYARFGLAYYQAECLHRGLSMILAWSGLPLRHLITRPRVEELLAQSFSLTLGDVVARLEGVLPPELITELKQAAERRNFLAHGFWFERAHLMFSTENVHQLILELDMDTELFESLDQKVSEWSKPKRQELGITDKEVQDIQNEILSGKLDEPLPDKRTARELEKKLAKKQRLARVWEFTLENSGKPLIFELADGSLWQLCDIGLGWTRFQEIGPDWVEHPKVKPYLPADIWPRPKNAKAWDYEFTLANGAVFWVKPGSKKAAFKWGVKTSQANAN